MLFNSTRTIYNLKLNTAKLINGKYRPELNTTLNEKFDVYPNYDYNSDVNLEYPKLNLFVLGFSDTNIIDNNLINLKRANHSPKDGALFNHIPFLIREAGTILTDEENKKYRLKSRQKINDIYYDCYYGYIIDNITYDDRIFKIKLHNGLSKISPIDTNEDPNILNPKVYVNDDITNKTNAFLLNTCNVKISLTKEEVTEILNNAKLLGFNKDTLVLNEIGLCTSIETEIDNRKENIWTQINYFVDVTLDLQLKDNGNVTIKDLEYNIDIGGMEPLMLPE